MIKTTKRTGRVILNGMMDIPDANDPRWLNIDDAVAQADAMEEESEKDSKSDIDNLHDKVWAKWNGHRNAKS